MAVTAMEVVWDPEEMNLSTKEGQLLASIHRAPGCHCPVKTPSLDRCGKLLEEGSFVGPVSVTVPHTEHSSGAGAQQTSSKSMNCKRHGQEHFSEDIPVEVLNLLQLTAFSEQYLH